MTACGESYVSAAILSAQLEQSFEKTEEEKQRQVRQIRRWTWTVAGTAVASMAFGLTAMFIEASIVCYLAFVFPLVTAPYTIYQRRRLNKLPTLAQEINLCRQLINRMSILNKRLEMENNRLGTQVSKLKASEERLHGIANESGIHVNELQELCRENAEILKKMKRLERAKELQSLLRIVLQCDGDNDRHMSEEELDRLSQRLQVFSNSRLPIDDGILRDAFRMSGASAVSTTTLFKQTRDLMAEQDRMDAKEGDDFWWEDHGYESHTA